MDEPVALADVAGRGWTLEDLTLPVLALRETALAHNLELMARYCREHGVGLAPHGKTTMAPALWHRQLAAGAWGITAANVTQARAMRAAGVPRVLIANEVVDPAAIAWLAEACADPAFEVTCYVDARRGIELLEAGIAVTSPLPVLVELGIEDGRTGCRSDDGAAELAARVRSSDRLRLAGVAGYEGVIGSERSPEVLARVSGFLDRLRGVAEAVLAQGPPETGLPFLVTAGGSAFFDVVVERLGGWPDGDAVQVLLRSGCYVTHDHARYERSSPMPASLGERGFRPALELWSAVLSRPEPGLTLLGFGRRDAPFDQGLPIPIAVRDPQGTARDADGALRVRELNDQHAYVELPDGFALEPGDVVASGISHPCTAFDRWRVLPVLDDDDGVIDAVATIF